MVDWEVVELSGVAGMGVGTYQVPLTLQKSRYM